MCEKFLNDFWTFRSLLQILINSFVAKNDNVYSFKHKHVAHLVKFEMEITNTGYIEFLC